MVEKYNIVVPNGIPAYLDDLPEQKRTLHASRDGNFEVNGGNVGPRREMMRSKLPNGV